MDDSEKSSPERHEFQFRGTFNHRRTHELLQSGVINAPEFALLAVIDSLDGPNGCYASKTYLATHLGIVPRHVQRMITHLIQLKLIWQEPKLKLSRGRYRRVLHVSSPGSPGDIFVSPSGRHFCLPNKDSSNTQRNGLPSVAGRKEKKMGFFGSDTMPDRKRSAPTDQEKELGGLLRDRTQKAFRYRSAARAKAWVEAVRLAKLDHPGGAAHVHRVLHWYADNCHKLDKPQIVHPKNIRNVKIFKWIEELMAADPLSIRISKDAKKVAGHIDHLGWPKGSKAQLLPAIQKTLDNLKEFDARMKEVAKDPNWRRTANRVYECVSGGFATTWFRAVFDKVGNWDGWNGNLMAYVFRHNHKLFRTMGRGWMQEYAGDPERWDRLMEFYDE